MAPQPLVPQPPFSVEMDCNEGCSDGEYESSYDSEYDCTTESDYSSGVSSTISSPRTIRELPIASASAASADSAKREDRAENRDDDPFTGSTGGATELAWLTALRRVLGDASAKSRDTHTHHTPTATATAAPSNARHYSCISRISHIPSTLRSRQFPIPLLNKIQLPQPCAVPLPSSPRTRYTMASAEQSITRGILERLVSGATASDLSTLPVLQILHYEQISKSADGRDRFKLALSDFDTKMMGGTGVQDVCDLIFKNLVRPYVVVRLTQFTCTRMSKTGMPIINIQGMQVLEEFGNCGNQMLGNPRAFGNQQLAAAPVKAELNQSAGFYGNQQPQQQPQQSLPHRTASKQMAPSARHANIYPIEALSPFGQKWTIKVRCTSVSDIKTWHNQRGEGHLFSVTFMDQSGEIKATGFNQECDNLRPLFEENQVYYISYPAKIGFAKRQYSNVNNDYEMTFESGTVVEKAEDPESVPQVRFNFTNISDLQNVDKDGLVDVIGIVKTVGEVGEAVSKATQKPYKKRELELVDETGFSIRLTIWGDQASTFNTSPDSVVAFKGLKVGDFGGRSLSLLSSGSMTVNPDVEEAFRLKGWYDAQGRNESFNTHNNLVSGTTGAAGGAATVYKTLAQVKDENIGMGDEGEYFTCKATIVFIKQGEFAYPACPNTDRCQKKVLEISEGEWRCEKCSQTFPAPHYRYLTSVHVNDHTGQIWLSCFDESGQVVFGTGAGELKRLQDEDPKQWEQIVKDASCRTWVFRVRAKQDTYMDQMRVRYQVVSCRAVEWAKEANRLAEVIKGYSM